MAEEPKGRTFKTPKARLSYAHLFVARVSEISDDNEPKYSCVLIFDRDAQATPEFAQLKQALAQAAKEKWGDKLPSNLKSAIRPGTDRDTDAQPEFGNGAVFINVSTKMKPGVVYPYPDPATGKPKRITDTSEIKSGDYVRATVGVYAYEVKGNRGVSFGLRNVQLLQTGEPLAGGKAAEDDFDVVDGAMDPSDLFS